MIVPSRRAFLGGGLALVAAPAIVRVSSLMPVKVVDPYYRRYLLDYDIFNDMQLLRAEVSTKPFPVSRFAQVLTEREALPFLPKKEWFATKPKDGQRLALTIPVYSEEMSTSFNGRTPPFDGGDFGSNPRVLANEQRR